MQGIRLGRLVMLRQAVVSDISGIQRVRHSVRENRLVSTAISDNQVREAISNGTYRVSGQAIALKLIELNER